MDNKLGRNYSLSIEAQNGSNILIEPPFTVEFDITRNIFSSANVSSIRIYNLAQNTRNQIRKNVNDYGDQRVISLKAGYGTNIPVVFSGSITQAWSVREGVNFITQIESFDGGFAFANAQTNLAFPDGTAFDDIIQTLAESLPGVSIGEIGTYPGDITRGNSYSGSTTDILRDITGGGFFIDLSKVYVLGSSEVLKGEIQIINAQSGLLGTPVREQTILNFSMLFEPRLKIGQQIQLDSITDINFNGFYKVISLHHRGMISETVCGDAITDVGLYYGTEALQLVGPV